MNTSYCEKHPYHIPRLYVEGVESTEYLMLTNEMEAKVVRECSKEQHCFGKIIYGSAIDFIDLVEKRVKKGFVVLLPPGYDKGVFVPKDAPIEPIPVEGIRASIEVCEGEKLKKWDTIGFVLTGKHEMRRIKTHVEGIVVYIYSAPEGTYEKNIVFVSPREVVKYIRVRR
ncbi:hypothetical protein PYJP_18620 [Pyrofollis japonicus]|uniref:DUF2118 domain-containing protein n=1 Tax=Pyrofollis japonicus TaxID=3060460 RepID=UPI00295A9F91|nr:DUF2118 domain-containing protein [Pyrofollis japonicus]BEP18510.1 hypothetical protein PYJP_18620 [Pyrofollis japonicus]